VNGLFGRPRAKAIAGPAYLNSSVDQRLIEGRLRAAAADAVAGLDHVATRASEVTRGAKAGQSGAKKAPRTITS